MGENTLPSPQLCSSSESSTPAVTTVVAAFMRSWPGVGGSSRIQARRQACKCKLAVIKQHTCCDIGCNTTTVLPQKKESAVNRHQCTTQTNPCKSRASSC